MIKIKRSSSYKDIIRAYKIVLDGKIVGEIKRDQEISLDTLTGTHQLYLKIDWCTSNKIDFDIKDGETINFECGNNTKFGMMILYITVLRNQYLWLKKI